MTDKDKIELAIHTLYREGRGDDKINPYRVRSWLIAEYGMVGAPEVADVKEHVGVPSHRALEDSDIYRRIR